MKNKIIDKVSTILNQLDCLILIYWSAIFVKYVMKFAYYNIKSRTNEK